MPIITPEPLLNEFLTDLKVVYSCLMGYIWVDGRVQLSCPPST